jgi:uncharacterized protein
MKAYLHPSSDPAHRLKILLVGVLGVVLAAGGAFGWSSTRADSGSEVARFVYHVDFGDPRRFSSMLYTIYNQVNYYQDQFIDYDIRVVFMSHGVRFVTADPLEGTPFAGDADFAERREELRARLASLSTTFDVKLELCDFTRREAGVAEAALDENVTLVPVAVARMGDLQHQGYAYIKIE